MELRTRIKIALLSGLIGFATQVIAQTEQANTTNTNIVAQTPEDDMLITQTVTKLIHGSRILSNQTINVNTSKGVVSLNGAVDSGTQASAAIELAESVIGVSDVDTSKLTVKGSKHPLEDTYITAKIKGLFIREKLFGEKDLASINISVETKNGIVYLSGVVDNQQQIDNAIKVIKKYVPEVKKVEYRVNKIVPNNPS